MRMDRKVSFGSIRTISQSNDGNEMDYVLDDLGGSSGRFQIFNYILCTVPVFISGYIGIAYVFTTLNLDYRCNIAECDNAVNPQYAAGWTDNVIPYDGSKYSKCHRYASLSNTNDHSGGYCEAGAFNQSNIIECDHGLVYRTDEVSIVNEFDITCGKNAQVKLSMVGAFNSLARFCALPLIGIYSDKFGRRAILIYGTLLCSIAGLVQSFAINYTMLVICEIIAAAGAATLYPSAIILGIEWAGARHRIVVSSLISLPLHIGFAMPGIVAAYTRNFRVYLRLLYAPALLSTALVLLGSESLRWLLVKGKRERVLELLSMASKINHCHLSIRSMDIINRKLDAVEVPSDGQANSCAENDDNSLKALLSSGKMAMRFCISAFCWITVSYVSQGVSIISVFLRGDRYFNYVLIALGGFPSSLIAIVLLKYVGRRKSMSICLFITSISNVVGKLLPNEYYYYSLTLFFTAKCFSMLAFLILYLQTSELWPTPLRQTMVGLSSTLGRIGTILAPLTPILTRISDMLPFWTFGITSLLAGILTLFLPETLNKELPDTIEQAKNLDKKN